MPAVASAPALASPPEVETDVVPPREESPSSAATPVGSVAGAVPPLAAAASDAPEDAIELRTSAPSWIEVTDGRGRALLSRLVQAGETLGLDGDAPFRIRIGNASGTRLRFHGQPMALAEATRDNVARLELK